MSDKPSKAPLAILDRTLFDNRLIMLLLKSFFSLAFKLRGWKALDNQPDGAGVTIAAPHTSNWDIFYAFGAAIDHDVKIYFSIKESWCRVPIIGPIVRYMGAIPIDRSSSSGGQVDKIIQFVKRNKEARVFFLVTPEGTRKAVDRWRTGFYHVARETGLPIFLAKVDYRLKEAGVFHSLQLTDNQEQDIAAIQASYESIHGKYPSQQFPAYTGPLPELSPPEERIIRAMYDLKDYATRKEIATKARLDSLNQDLLNFLEQRGILERLRKAMDGRLESANEKTIEGDNGFSYRLTAMGRGLFLHLQPS